jgi:hypothetical protein
MTNVMLTIRVPEQLRDEFMALATANDLTASQILRASMRSYVKTGGASVNPFGASHCAAPAPAPQEIIPSRTVDASSPLQPGEGKGPSETDAAAASFGHQGALGGIRAMLGMDDE